MTPDTLVAGDTAPQTLAVQVAPDKNNNQFTPLFCESFCKVATKACEPLTCTLDVGGDTDTTIAGSGVGAETVMVAAEDLVASVTEVAVSATVGGVGGAAGAVYVTAAPETLEAAESVPHAEPAQPVPDNTHVTPLFCPSCRTVAEKLFAWPA
jgi:hypothetical protein